MPICLNFFGFTNSSVSPTNFVYNLVAMPLGVWRLHREKRVLWGFSGLILLGSLPGIFLGTVLRCTWLQNPGDFKLFVGLVLLALLWPLVRSLKGTDSPVSRAEQAFLRERKAPTVSYTKKHINYFFGGESFSLPISHLVWASLIIGLVGGIYGIGGAAIIAPLLIGFFQVPIYLVNGVSLVAGWLGSIFGLISYAFIWPILSNSAPIYPDLKLGILFGLGGLVGVYWGSRLQGQLPPRPLKVLVLLLILVLVIQSLLSS